MFVLGMGILQSFSLRVLNICMHLIPFVSCAVFRIPVGSLLSVIGP